MRCAQQTRRLNDLTHTRTMDVNEAVVIARQNTRI